MVNQLTDMDFPPSMDISRDLPLLWSPLNPTVGITGNVAVSLPCKAYEDPHSTLFYHMHEKKSCLGCAINSYKDLGTKATLEPRFFLFHHVVTKKKRSRNSLAFDPCESSPKGERHYINPHY